MSIWRNHNVGSAKAKEPSKAHRKMIAVLYPRRVDSDVTPLGTYTTNYGKKRRVR